MSVKRYDTLLQANKVDLAQHVLCKRINADFMTYLQKSGGTMPKTLIRSHSSRAIVIVNQPVLNQELDVFLVERQREGEGERERVREGH